jgi:nucleotide-binding universal stress UspA family protein
MMMSGTILCGISTDEGGRSAVRMAADLAGRLGLRPVFAHVVELPRGAEDSVTGRQKREGAERAVDGLLGELAPESEYRIAVGPRAARLAQLAAEEGADLIVLGSRREGWRGRGLRCRLARELEAATPAPVVVAPPAAGASRRPSPARAEPVPVP